MPTAEQKCRRRPVQGGCSAVDRRSRGWRQTHVAERKHAAIFAIRSSPELGSASDIEE